MVVVEYTYEEMKRLVDLPLEKMIETLSNLGAPSEYEPDVKKIIAELTPNRPDWYSMEGLARSLKIYNGKKHPEYTAKKSDYKVMVDHSVSKIRPYTVCVVIKNLKLNDQRVRDIILLQEKLINTLGRKVKKFGLGVYPLHAINFPIKYTTMNPEEIEYIPLGYDRPLNANQILAEHKKGNEHGHILAGHKRYPVFVDNKNKIMALIPIVNSAETGKVDEKTTEIFVEVTGNEEYICMAALNILTCTFADMGGVVYSVEVKYKDRIVTSPVLSNRKIKLDHKQITRILGIELKEKEIVKYLTMMGYGYVKGVVSILPYRADIIGEIDIIEDIAIAYGYNNFKPTLPDFFSSGNIIKQYNDADDILRGMGFLELKTFILTNELKLENIGYKSSTTKIANPNTQDYTIVRPNLLVSMLDVFELNKMKKVPQKVYEIDIVREDERTEKRISFGLMDRNVDFSTVRGYLQTLMNEIGNQFELEHIDLDIFDNEISSKIIVNGKQIGVFGKVNKGVLDKLGIGFDICLCEITSEK